MTDRELCLTFLPPAKPGSKAEQNVVDFLGSSEEFERSTQFDRWLGTFGWETLHGIETDYKAAVGEWRIAFEQVVSAYGLAVNRQQITLGEAAKELEREAAFKALILSLATAGVMRFLGAYLQYTILPTTNMPRIPHFTRKTDDFMKAQAAAFGGIGQDIGNTTVRGLGFPQPIQAPYSLNTWAGVSDLRVDLLTHLHNCEKMVTEQFATVKRWMKNSEEFGRAWLVRGDGSESIARIAILIHFEGLRQKWAAKWEFYGTSPLKINRDLLAHSYERAMWADYVLKAIAAYVVTLPGTIDVALKTTMVTATVVNRLKELNVVLAETNKGWQEQHSRMIQGSPTPVAKVIGSISVNEKREAKDIMAWASGYLKNAPIEFEQKFFPPALKRALPPL